MHLNQFLARCGVCSRRQACELIKAGLVKVNGQVVTDLSALIDDLDKVTLRGQTLTPKIYQYLKLNKPAGFVTTHCDEKNRPTVYALLPAKFHHLNPVGRLDFDSTGLLIFTNDGDLIQKLTHPRVKVAKRYLVTAQGIVTKENLVTLKNGMRLENSRATTMAYAEAKILGQTKRETKLLVTLYQGLNRQIRKMFGRLGHPVITLTRISHGPFRLGQLAPGAWQEIEPPRSLSCGADYGTT